MKSDNVFYVNNEGVRKEKVVKVGYYLVIFPVFPNFPIFLLEKGKKVRKGVE